MDYIRCTGCGVVCYEIHKYKEEFHQIGNDRNIKKKEKIKMQAKLLDKYGYDKWCCRSKILPSAPLIHHKIIMS